MDIFSWPLYRREREKKKRSAIKEQPWKERDHHHSCIEGEESHRTTLPSGIIVSPKKGGKKKSTPTGGRRKKKYTQRVVHPKKWRRSIIHYQRPVLYMLHSAVYIRKKGMTRIYVPSNTSFGWQPSDLIVHEARGIHFQYNSHPPHVCARISFLSFFPFFFYIPGYFYTHKKKTEPHPSSSHRQIDRNISSYRVRSTV